jgi:hypothetical protein
MASSDLERRRARTSFVGLTVTRVRKSRAGSSPLTWKASSAAGYEYLIGDLDQWIDLVTQPRYFGGRQWYFECPVTHRHCSVLWMPPGARRFCSRQTWRRQVAYASQFETPADRAYRGQAKIKSKLIGDHDPDEGELPPKPKWMRWHTYNRYEQKFDAYEDIRDRHLFVASEFDDSTLDKRFRFRQVGKLLGLGAHALNSSTRPCCIDQPREQPSY